MNKIITINREFGSGGRELGKRLADALNVPCYDNEIIELIAKENGFDAEYVANISEKSVEAAYPMTIGHRFAAPFLTMLDQPIRVAVSQRKIIENFAKQGDCVIVGRAADAILKEEFHPLNLFVYANMQSKVKRCMDRAPEGENLSAQEMEKKIKQIDKARAQHHEMYDDGKWGDKSCYDLCINTSGREIKYLVPAIAQYCMDWFNRSEG